MKINPIEAIPYEIVSNFIRDVAGVKEKHQYVKIQGSNPVHLVEYIVYDKNGRVQKDEINKIDKLA